MENCPAPRYLRDLCRTLTRGILLTIIIPLVPAFLLGIPLSSCLALISGTFIVEYGAAALGIGLGLNPIYILFVLISVASGVILTLFDIFDILGKYSSRVKRFLEKSEKRAHQSIILTKYGILGLIPCVFILGFYVCPAVSHVFGWRRDLSILLVMGGYISASVLTLLVAIGILRFLS